MNLTNIGLIKTTGWALASIATVSLLIVVNTIGVQALKVKTEIKSMPAGIAKIINTHGTPPNGMVEPRSNHTALTINTDIDFGTAFPGEILSGEFKVMLTDPELGGQYTRVEYHLVITGMPGKLDLSPYLTEVRDTAETDIDPDTPVQASVDSNQGDIFDRWIVTMTLPDNPSKGDYHTTITVWVDNTIP